MSHDFSSIMLLIFGSNFKDSVFFTILLALYIAFDVFVQNQDIIMETSRKLWQFWTKSISIQGKIIVNNGCNYQDVKIPISLKAVLYVLNKTRPELYDQMTSAVQLIIESGFDLHSLKYYKDTLYLPTQSKAIYLTDKVYMYIDIKSKLESQEGKYDKVSITLTLATKQNIKYIKDYIENCIEQYKVLQTEEINRQMYIFKIEFQKDDRMCSVLVKHKIPFVSSKTFDNLYFDGKDKLLQRITAFKDKQMCKSLGIPDSLGLLFYGEPGTGKTSAIKAIANELRMHIIIVPMTVIKTRDQLESMFYTSCYNNMEIPQNKRIYVFEEIDCNGWFDIIKQRDVWDTQENIEKAMTNAMMNAMTNAMTDVVTEAVEEVEQDSTQTTNRRKKGVTTITCDNKKPDDKLTLGGFLEVLDGLIELPGRVVIMTTNRRHVIDSAITRPGRIDLEIEFKKLRKQDIADIYRKWCGKELGQDIMCKLKDYTYTQCQLAKLMFDHINDPVGLIAELTSPRSHPLVLKDGDESM